MSIFKKRRIFLDFFGGRSNPSGIHKEGREAREVLSSLRERVSSLLHSQTRDIIFTSGGTESNNLAVLGVFEASREIVSKPHIIISSGEHPSVVESVLEAKRRGAELSIVPREEVLKNIKENTVLVSVVHAENETGNINNVGKLARQIRDLRNKLGSKYPLLHTDTSGTFDVLEVDINKVSADLITIDKVLVVRPNVSIKPIIFGGGQERGLRSGTENLVQIDSFVRDLEKSFKDREKNFRKLSILKETFLNELEEKLPEAKLNTVKESIPNVVSISFEGKLHEFLAIKLDLLGVAVSTGSSCDSNKNEQDKEALRFSFDVKNTKSEIRRAIRILKDVVV